MSETNAKAFFDYLDNSLASTAAKTSGYTYSLDALEQLGWLTSATLVASAAEASTISFPSGAVRLLHLFYDDRQLSRETREALRRIGGDYWRDRISTPVAFTEDDEADRTFRPYPRPSVANSALSYPNSEPFGRDYPTNAFVTVTSDRTDPPTWLDVPCALLMLAHVRTFESANQDLQLAEAATTLAQALLGLIDHA